VVKEKTEKRIKEEKIIKEEHIKELIKELIKEKIEINEYKYKKYTYNYIMNFDAKVQQWVQIDNELKKLSDHVKKLREHRNDLELQLTNYAKNNHMINSTIQLNQDKLKFVDTKVPEPLTFRYLEKTLGEIIKDESKVQLIMERLKQKRSVKIVPEIKRFSIN